MGVPYVSVFERRAKEQGVLLGLKKGIASALKGRFGKVDKRLMARVEAITEVEKLDAVMEAISGQETIKQIRGRLQSS